MYIYYVIKREDMIEITRMAKELMSTTFTYRGTDYNMSLLGWNFSYSTKKNSLGTCRSRTKQILLSKWMINNTNEDISVWRNTMLHEIAHGIDTEIRGRSSHDFYWKDIATSIGCIGERTSDITINPRSSKYTLKCNSCGMEIASHKRRKRDCSCNNCGPGVFDRKYLLEQIQNY